MTYTFDPLVPRPIDLPTAVPLEASVPADVDLDAPGTAVPDLSALDDAKIFAAPDDPAQWSAWRARLAQWRADARRRYGYSGAAYERPGGAWGARCFTVAQVWLWDELLYSFAEHRFTPERLLRDAQQRFAGLDGVVLWHAYPVIGIDDRNQWDFYRDVPGLAGPNGLVAALQAAGLHVFVDYNPWDTGTRRGADDVSELADVVTYLGADGVFLDTLKKAEPELVERLERARPGIVLEGESKLAVERTEDHVSSWAQFFADSPVPGVLRAHWYERRHMQHHVRRWHRDHSAELQSAWLNGVGIMVWEVVFGVWVGWSARDAATVRRMVTVQRAATDLLLEGEWTPLAELQPQAHAHGVYASRFTRDGVSLWALVNRSEEHYTGPVLPPGADFDGTHGAVVDVTGGGTRTETAADGVRLTVPGRGVAAVVQLDPGTDEPAWLAPLLRDMAGLDHDDDASFPHRLAHRVRTAPAILRHEADPDQDAVVVPAGPYVLTVRYRARETGMYQGAPYVDEWKPLPPRLHDARTLQRDGVLDTAVAVARREVSNAEYARFLNESGYHPRHGHRFLAHWPAPVPTAPLVDRAEWTPPRGREDEPVTYVDLDDARAYCAWRGGRLPTEDEWQLAAPGFARRRPAVWSWTESEHSDGRTRFVMLKGGSEHGADGSDWYFDGGVQEPDFTAKLLLPGLGLARSAAIGFRCAWEVPA